MMEWYWVVAIVVAFLGILVAFYFLKKSGKVSATAMEHIKTLLDGFNALMDSFGTVVQNDATRIFGAIVDLLRSAVYAAENAWYNGEIEKDERKEQCLEIFHKLLDANNVELTPQIEGVLDALIAGICEEMGHESVIDLDDIELALEEKEAEEAAGK